MKKHVSDLPVEIILRAAQKATQQAAIDAVAAGRNVWGWEGGKIVKYGPGAQPLSKKNGELKKKKTIKSHPKSVRHTP